MLLITIQESNNIKKFRLETFDIQNLTREINVGLLEQLYVLKYLVMKWQRKIWVLF